MARKRTRMRRDPHTFLDGMAQGHHSQPNVTVDGTVVNIRKLSAQDEGVLYTMQITERPVAKRKPRSRLSRLLRKKYDDDDELLAMEEEEELHANAPQSETLSGRRSVFNMGYTGKHGGRQFTIKPTKKYKNPILNWIDANHLNILDHANNVDQHLYKPSSFMFHYINWTFRASFTAVFMSFLVIFYAINLFFAWLLLEAGINQPECIIVSGDHFGTTDTKFSDAFALSWTTFTTVGYGMTYTSTGNNFGGESPTDCSWIVFLCTAEAFVGLLYAGMCAAILFGKVNRIQSHANLIFCNAVCLQYEEVDPSEEVDADDTDAEGGPERSSGIGSRSSDNNLDDFVEDEENPAAESATDETKPVAFVEQFNGCPVLKFQVVNMLANKQGSEMVDAIMKVIGVKHKMNGERITQSQYVRVNLVDFEHPFFSRVWHGVHILDGTSPLLKESAKKKILENGGSWPSEWFKPKVIHDKLDFEDLVVTVAGISNISAVTVHSYKRYKKGDVLIGFNFAPLVFQNKRTGVLEVDLSLAHDVREQRGGGGEDLRQSGLKRHQSIRIKKSSVH